MVPLAGSTPTEAMHAHVGEAKVGVFHITVLTAGPNDYSSRNLASHRAQQSVYQDCGRLASSPVTPPGHSPP